MLKYTLLILILLTATIIYVAYIKNGSGPYAPDSLFYEHMFYQLQGNSYQQARNKVLKNHPQAQESAMFSNQEEYKNSYSFFERRPLYPATAAFINIIINNRYIAFFIPLFFAYITFIFISQYFFSKSTNYFVALMATSLIIAYREISSWSTTFMADIISTAFWMFLVLCIYKYLTEKRAVWILTFSLFLTLSLLTKEQNILMLPLLIILFILLLLLKPNLEIKEPLTKLILSCLLISIVYTMVFAVTGQKTITFSLTYIKSGFSLPTREFTNKELVSFYIKNLLASHSAFLNKVTTETVPLIILAGSLAGVLKTYLTRNFTLLDLVIMSSGIASYMAVFLIPLFEQRYFFPATVTIIYFFAKFVDSFFKSHVNNFR